MNKPAEHLNKTPQHKNMGESCRTTSVSQKMEQVNSTSTTLAAYKTVPLKDHKAETCTLR